MIVLGTPMVTLDFGIPNWAVVLIIGLMTLSYYIGKQQGRKAELIKQEDNMDETIEVPK